MSISTLISRKCTLLVRSDSASRDDYGNKVVTTTTTAGVCEMQPMSSDEADSSEEISRNDYVAYFPAGTDLSTADAVTVDGITYELVGTPTPRQNPRTRTDLYVKAYVRRIAGAEDAT